jgi:hypothetical protein
LRTLRLLYCSYVATGATFLMHRVSGGWREVRVVRVGGL